VRRREFITLIGGAAAAWPLVTHAQQLSMPVIGFVSSTSLAPFAKLVAAFRQGLEEAGFVEGQNVAVEYRYAESQTDRVPAGRLDPPAGGRDCRERCGDVRGQGRDDDRTALRVMKA
jgi:hypothetical protein